jgi:hypothetical protein
MDTLTQDFINTVVYAMVDGTIPANAVQEQKQKAVENFEEYYNAVIPTCVDAVRVDPLLLSSLPVTDKDASMDVLINALVIASKEDDLNEIARLTAYFNFMVQAHVNFIRQYPGIFQEITEYNPERIPQYVNAIVEAIILNMYPPDMPVNPNDISMLTWYYTKQITAYVLYVRANPTIFNPIEGEDG